MDAHHKRGHQCTRVSRVCIRRRAAAHTPQRDGGQPQQTYPARFDAQLVHGPGLNGTLMGFNFLGSLEPDGRRTASHKYQSRRAVRRSKDNGCGSLRPPRGCGRRKSECTDRICAFRFAPVVNEEPLIPVPVLPPTK